LAIGRHNEGGRERVKEGRKGAGRKGGRKGGRKKDE
jgi:hypothetical protein